MSEVDKLRAEIDLLGVLATDREEYLELLTAENNKLRAALRECEAELNAYYRMEYPGDHPYSQKKLAKAMSSNPATVALEENNNDQC